MHIELQQVAPAEIEARSMEIIRSELKQPLPPEQAAVRPGTTWISGAAASPRSSKHRAAMP